MTKIDKKSLQILAQNIMLKLDNLQLEKIINEFNVILKQMELVQKIDTTNVSSIHYPFDIIVDYLRDDDNGEVESQKNILINAPKYENGYIVINRVIK